jgi:hypothetical protein
MDILIELHYAPCIRYFSKFWLFDNVIIDDVSPFQKQSYRNRCIIAGANGSMNLIIPVHDSRKQLSEKDIRIDNHSTWQRQHWQSIRSAYGKSAYYEHYAHKFEDLYNTTITSLFDFNIELITLLMKILKIDTDRLKIQSNYQSQTIVDYRGKIHPKAKFSMHDDSFKINKYHQAFEEKYGFVANLSVMDLIFNTGPQAARILRESIIV